MMFQTGFVACIKVNGQILRETSDAVSLPFGSSYSILIKNLNSVRAQVKVAIDGTDATDGTHLVIAPNGQIELERFIRNGNLNSGNKLKFIERSVGIESHRGIKAEDGLIRVEAWKEKITPVLDIPVVRHHYHDYHHYPPYYWPRWPYPESPYWYGGSGGPLGGDFVGSQTTTSCNTSQTLGNAQSFTKSAVNTGSSSILRGQTMNMMVQSDAGITVAGAESNQSFQSVIGFPLESKSTVIVLRLRGHVGKKVVVKPVTVKSSKKCDTCGKSNKGGGLFCGGCGASLVII